MIALILGQLVALFLLVRDNVLPDSWRQELQLSKVPSLDPKSWALAALAMFAVFLLEGAYGVVARERTRLTALNETNARLRDQLDRANGKVSDSPQAIVHLESLKKVAANFYFKSAGLPDPGRDDNGALLAHFPNVARANAEVRKAKVQYDRALVDVKGRAHELATRHTSPGCYEALTTFLWGIAGLWAGLREHNPPTFKDCWSVDDDGRVWLASNPKAWGVLALIDDQSDPTLVTRGLEDALSGILNSDAYRTLLEAVIPLEDAKSDLRDALDLVRQRVSLPGGCHQCGTAS